MERRPVKALVFFTKIDLKINLVIWKYGNTFVLSKANNMTATQEAPSQVLAKIIEPHWWKVVIYRSYIGTDYEVELLTFDKHFSTKEDAQAFMNTKLFKSILKAAQKYS